jgi:hypothetical protein
VRGPTGSRDSLRDVARAALDELAEVESATGVDATAYSHAGHPFAHVTENALEVRLEGLVAQAALRTPDTEASPHGPGWVRFTPRAMDRYAADRVTAWIEHAWRHAAE